AVMEIEQSPDGRLLSWRLVERSGNPLFDTYVEEAAPKAIAALDSPFPERSRRDSVPSRYEVLGKPSFLKRKVRDYKVPSYLPSPAAMLGIGQLGGNFDLTAMKDIEVVDFRHPMWKIGVKLLSAE